MEILTVLSLFFELLVDFLPFILIIMITISLKKIAQNQKKSAAKVVAQKKQETDDIVKRGKNLSEVSKGEHPQTSFVSKKKQTTLTQRRNQSRSLEKQPVERPSSASTLVPPVAKQKITPQPIPAPHEKPVLAADTLVQAMIYKEILDKPLALRD